MEYTEIELTCKRIGAKHTRINSDGSPVYTVPVIYDPNTKTVMEESLKIAQYLDNTYPDAPRLIPDGAFVLHNAFSTIVESTVLSIVPILILPLHDNLNPISADFFRNAREKDFGTTLEKWVPKGEEECDKILEVLEQGLGRIAGWFTGGQTGPFVMGDVTTFSDMILGAWIIWLKIVFGEGSREWGKIGRMNGGFCERHLELLAEYENSL